MMVERGRVGNFVSGKVAQGSFVDSSRIQRSRFLVVSRLRESPASRVHDPSFSEPGSLIRKSRSAASGIGDDFVRYFSGRLRSIAATSRGLSETDHRFVNPRAVSKLAKVLIELKGESVVYPTIHPNAEGGLIAEWRSGPQVIIIEIEGDESIGDYFCSTDADGNITLEKDCFEPECFDCVEGIKKQLFKLSEKANSENPSWRKMFR
ncbi:hypothetical protein ACIBFB_13465 [Nocardiopsis sp. NPDC050513]|uniref:hypothetical protein n=1 Tax=Nocardiopsis sp. NPDC050513 TaxID=3364338 RepID=UPI0037A3741A